MTLGQRWFARRGGVVTRGVATSGVVPAPSPADGHGPDERVPGGAAADERVPGGAVPDERVPGGAERHTSLAALAPGSRATVVRVAGGPPGTARRLGELGFTPGTVVEVVRRAPLRDPVIYRLKDYEVCLRRAQAACVRTTGMRVRGTEVPPR